MLSWIYANGYSLLYCKCYMLQPANRHPAALLQVFSSNYREFCEIVKMDFAVYANIH